MKHDPIWKMLCVGLGCCWWLLSSGLGLAAAPQTADSTYQQVLDRLTQLTPTENIELQMEAEKHNYPMGAAVELRFVVATDGYVLLMRIAPNGAITFPLPEQPVLSGQVYSTGGTTGTTAPDNGMHDLGLNLTCGTTAGPDVFNLVYSPEKIGWLSADFVNDPAYIIAPTHAERLQRLLTGLDQLSQRTWSGTSVALIVGPLVKSAVPRKNGAIPPISATGTTGKEATRDDARPVRRKLWNTSSGD